MQFPDELLYTAEHEWVKLNADGTAIIGITDFAQQELGDIVFVDINSVGQTVAGNEIFGSVEAVKTVSDLYMPVEGVVLEVNAELNNQPELVNSDPYGKGWMIKAEVIGDISALLSATAYKNLIGA